jgi:hypothetical protein
MHSPQFILIQARRTALGDEHPDFSGPAGLIEAKRTAQAPPEPPEPPEPEPDSPDSPDQGDLEHGAARIAAELRQIADRSCELAEELAGLAGSEAPQEGDEGPDEGTGMPGELKAREPGAKG